MATKTSIGITLGAIAIASVIQAVILALIYVAYRLVCAHAGLVPMHLLDLFCMAIVIRCVAWQTPEPHEGASLTTHVQNLFQPLAGTMFGVFVVWVLVSLF